MSNLQELREHLKELENSFEIGSFTKENIKEYAKCFFMSLSIFLEEQEKNQQEEFLEQDTKENQEELIKSIQTSIAKNQELEKISFEKQLEKLSIILMTKSA
ncbi:virB8 type IV secretion protein [Helicobacter pylori Hp H-27]|nr:virB8 type IV secretion protein [Helicobacter pylori Hp H-27]